MIGNDKYITIATDAGRDFKYKIAYWAGYIVSPAGVIQHAAPFKEYNSQTAYLETLALANTLVIADNNLDVSQHKIVVYNEIEYIIRPVDNKRGRTPKATNDARTSVINDVIMPILNKAISYEIRDVKAHQKLSVAAAEGNPAKYKMNRWCDAACRNIMKQLKAGMHAGSGEGL